MIWKVRNCCKMCENLVCVATTTGQLQHSEYLKLTFLDTFKWAMRSVFPEPVTFNAMKAHTRCCKGACVPHSANPSTPRPKKVNSSMSSLGTKGRVVIAYSTNDPWVQQITHLLVCYTSAVSICS